VDAACELFPILADGSLGGSLVSELTQFFASNPRTKVISRDLFVMSGVFLRMHHSFCSLKSYSVDDAWPAVLDEFVQSFANVDCTCAKCKPVASASSTVSS